MFQATNHERKGNRSDFDLLDNPHEDKADQLNESEGVDPDSFDVPQEYIIRLVLDRHEEYGDPFDELNSGQRGYAHVEEDTVQDWHWYQL